MDHDELSAHDVARELRRRIPSAGTFQIQKLLYYCNGWNIAWNGEPLFRERVEAWEQGPVVADLWHDEKHDHQLPPERELTGSQVAVVEYVVSRYGSFTSEELRYITHHEDPWRNFADADGVLRVRNAEITHDAMRVWFTHDGEYLAHRTEVARLRKRRDVYGFEGPAITPELRAAAARVLDRPIADAHPA